ncbi:sensor histidine kinase [Domibacillus enclensis]|uniref:histidine kinase n=1 Tax=Domibacillus enclensis TaxID=1017273 RepID=A0A1N6ZF76_9BACI|nr:PAS domain-containing sensor histidine kinase [Domibacillus enclensis]OXS76686.1 histidine kinase [Domibacillus enclensis]SIR25475.1 Two-component sensor histidine kinase, contains HisKA and HATPase domains [Domibacillus enclensis]
MNETALEQLCRLYTDLTDSDIQVLKETAKTLPLYAELSGHYMFIDCMMKSSGQAVVVAEALPRTPEAAYKESVVGKIVFETFEPGVHYSHRTGKKSIRHRAITQEGKMVEQSVVPIRNDQHEVIGTLITEAEIAGAAGSFAKAAERPNISFGSEALGHLLADTVDDYPIVTDLLMEIFLVTDADQRLVYANPAGVRFIHEMNEAEDIQNKPILTLLPFLTELLEHQEEVFISEVSVASKTLEVKKVKMHSKTNELKGILFIIQDLTELRTKEKELLMKSVVIKEIHHRVKNNLQTVASLLRLQMRKGFPAESRSHFEDTLNRIFSISSVYEMILANEHADEDDVDLIELTRKIGSTMVLNDLNQKVDLIIESNGNKILTSSRKAVSIALIVNELIQNSLKHAFPGELSGTIQVDFFSHKKFAELHIRDNGVGMAGAAFSLGLEIVHNLVVNDLAGEFSYKNVESGTHAAITFPLSPEVVIHYEKTDSDR